MANEGTGGGTAEGHAGQHAGLISRLDAARATLEEAAGVLDDLGEEDAYYDARIGLHVAGEAAAIIEEHDGKNAPAGPGGGPGTGSGTEPGNATETEEG